MSILKTPESALVVGKGLQNLMAMISGIDVEFKKLSPFLDDNDTKVKHMIEDFDYWDYRVKNVFTVYREMINEAIELDLKEKTSETIKLAE